MKQIQTSKLFTIIDYKLTNNKEKYYRDGHYTILVLVKFEIGNVIMRFHHICIKHDLLQTQVLVLELNFLNY